ncbi:MAG TPA: hypothetical protein VGP17_11195 [Solirubrobacteraceae bacterium]|nr:hypothetical protein [Solirubrobacteraceae bacterium]
MIAYLLWHRPRQGVDPAAYEQAAERFHRSLAHARPAGLRSTALLRADALPWLAGEGWYEDWYLLEDFGALGVLNEAAVAAGHRSAHENIARSFGSGAGALYKLIEGGGDSLAHTLAVWVSRPAGASSPGLGDMLGDGMDREHASLWRRALVLGPAPEYCLLAAEPPAGVSPTRLPQGWQADLRRRDAIFAG